MLLPFPNIASTLAKKPHMYICLEESYPKKFIKCQTFKSHYRKPNTPPQEFIEVLPDIKHNPFIKSTLIDCDKSFCLDRDVVISEALLTTRRRDISEELFGELEEKIDHEDFKEIILNTKIVVQLNNEIEQVG